jgi:hypothetical protein
VRDRDARRSYAQLSPAGRERLVHRALLVNLGTNGSTLLEAARVLLYIGGYARARGWSEAETWPISRAVAASLIEGEHGRATAEAKGAQGGATVGGRLRSTLKSLRDHFGYPIDLNGPLVEGAAPASGSFAPGPAASLPAQIYCQLETVAGRESAPALARGLDVARFFARCMLLVALTSIRLRDAVRVRFAPDTDRPNTRIYGLITIRDGKKGTKDGAPMELFVFAPAEGILGQFCWLPQHLAHMEGAGGTPFLISSAPTGAEHTSTAP